MTAERREEFKRLMACIEESRAVMERIFPVHLDALSPGIAPEPVQFTASGWAEYEDARAKHADWRGGPPPPSSQRGGPLDVTRDAFAWRSKGR